MPIGRIESFDAFILRMISGCPLDQRRVGPDLVAPGDLLQDGLPLDEGPQRAPDIHRRIDGRPGGILRIRLLDDQALQLRHRFVDQLAKDKNLLVVLTQIRFVP